MKTKLLCLLLFVGYISNAQVFFGNPYATDVTSVTATLNVYMNLNNTYQVGYQISTDSNFAGAPVEGQQNTFSGTYNLTKPVSGLTQNTTYFIRFRALSGGNATYSAVGTFTTQSLAPEILIVTANPVTANSATINYTLNANGSNATSVIKYGTDALVTNQVAGFPATGASDTPGNIEISGLSPNTQYFYQIETTNGYGTRTSHHYTFTTTSLTPVISNVSSTVTTDSAIINYTVNSNADAATSLVKYGLTSDAMTNQLSGFSVVANTAESGNVPIPGLAPNTQYFYQIEATNSFGTTSSSVGNFTTNQAPQIIAEYTFDNTYDNINGNTPFTSVGTSFVEDRFGVANKALSSTDTNGITASITGLPTGSNTRTISLWFKRISGDGGLVYYGTEAQNQKFSLFFNAGGSINFTMSLNMSVTLNTGGVAVNVWHHLVATYDGASVRFYFNGNFASTIGTTLNTENGDFKLGGVTGHFDDLKIYNYALTATDVWNLFIAETPSLPQCPTGNVALSSQAEVDAFAFYYPNCTEITGHLSISGTVTDLSPLSNLVSVGGSCTIQNTSSLTSLYGLHNIISAGIFYINGNNSLTSLSTLSLTSSVGIQVSNNSLLTSLSGLESLISLNNQPIGIYNNSLLSDIAALQNIAPNSIAGDWISSGLSIVNNPLLDACNLSNFCTYLQEGGSSNVSENATNCLNQQAVTTACASMSVSDYALNSITIYPNPVKDILNIETDLEVQSVEIYTIQGQKVVSSTKKQINVSNLASGIYLVKTQDSNNKISINKIMVK